MNKWNKNASDYVKLWLEFQIEQQRIPGLQIAIRQNRGLILNDAFGFASMKNKIKLSTKHQFRVASHSKTFTAAGILKLVEQKEIRLSDKIGKYFPVHTSLRSATIENLLTHQAGLLRDGYDSGFWRNEFPFPNKMELLEILKQKSTTPVCSRMKYSNFGYGILGLIIEHITSNTYNQWISEQVITPSRLTNTFPDFAPMKRYQLANGHNSSLVMGKAFDISPNIQTNTLASAGGFISNAFDLSQFFEQLSQPNKNFWLSDLSRRLIARPYCRIPGTKNSESYGLGMIHGKIADLRYYGHSGGFYGFRSQTAHFPDTGITISILVNSVEVNVSNLMEGVVNILKQFASEKTPSQPSSKNWRGRWWSTWGAQDFLPFGKKVFVINPQLIDPFANKSIIQILKPSHKGKIILANGYENYGETVSIIKNKTNKTIAIKYGAVTMSSRDYLRRNRK